MRLIQVTLLLVVLSSTQSCHAACTDWLLHGEPQAYEISWYDVVNWGDYVVFLDGARVVSNSVSPSSELIEVSEVTLSNGQSGYTRLIVSGNHIFATRPGYVSVIEISAGGSMQLVHVLEMEDISIHSAVYKDQYLYLSGIRSTETGWTVVTSVYHQSTYMGDWPYYLRDVILTLHGDFIVATHTSHGIQIIDVENPLNPMVVGSVELDYAAGVVIRDERAAYVAGDGNYVGIIDLTDLLNPRVIDEIPIPWNGMFDVNYRYEMDMFNKEILVANHEGGFLAVSMEDDELNICDTLWDDCSVDDIFMASDRLWLSKDGELSSLPLFNPVELLFPELSIHGRDILLTWDRNGAAEFTIYRSSTPYFDENVERLGSTSQNSWIDLGALRNGNVYYQIRMGLP